MASAKWGREGLVGGRGRSEVEKGGRGGSLRESVAKATSSVPSSESTSRLFEPRSEWGRHFKAIPALSSGNSSPPPLNFNSHLRPPLPPSPPHLVLLALNFDLISSIALEGLEFGMVPGERGMGHHGTIDGRGTRTPLPPVPTRGRGGETAVGCWRRRLALLMSLLLLL